MKTILTIQLICGLVLCSLVTFAMVLPPFLDTATPVSFLRYMFFAPGWFVLLSALFVRLRASSQQRLFVFTVICIPLSTLIHFAVTVINAHADAFLYWSVQLSFCAIITSIAIYAVAPEHRKVL